MALSAEEAEFPLAFSIAMYTDVEQTERLLRAIYQPQNLYCIHVDTKSSLLIHRTIAAIARCFNNVWVATHVDKIKWGDVRSVTQSGTKPWGPDGQLPPICYLPPPNKNLTNTILF